MKRTFLSCFILLTCLAAWADADKVQKQLESFEPANGKTQIALANDLMKTFKEEEILDETIQFSLGTHPDTLRMQVWYWAAEYFYALQDYQQSVAYGRHALPLCKGTDMEADCLSILSLAYFRMSDYKRAAYFAKECYKLDEVTGDPDIMSSSLNTLAGIYIGANQPKEAEQYILKAIQLAQQVNNPARLAVINGMASEVYKNLHNDTLALQYATRAYEIETALGRTDKAAVRQTEMASALVGLQRAAEAKKVLLEAIPVLRETQNLHSLGIACNHMGLLLIQEHTPQEAVRYFNEALDIFTQQGDIYNEALSHRGLYQALYKSDPTQAMLHNHRYNDLRDSLYDKETGQLLSKYAALYGNEELLLENETMQRNHRRVLLYGGALVCLLALLTWIIYRMHVRRQRRHTAELMQEIDRVSRQYETMRIGRDNLPPAPSQGEGATAVDTSISPLSEEQGEVLDERDREFILRLVEVTDAAIARRECSVDAIASDLNMSTATLRRRVIDATGDTPKAVISAIQMQKACILLSQHPDMPIGDVALQCGFDEIGNFTRTFKRTFGITPSQFARDESAASGSVSTTP